MVVDQPAVGTAPGYVFLAPFGSKTGASPGPLVVDDTGEPVWFLPLKTAQAQNFRVQSYRGQPVITWYESQPGALYGGSCVIYDPLYHELKRVHGGHGYAVDLHEFVITSRDTGLLAIANVVSAGGTEIVEGIVQELDIATGKVLFEWRSLDHVPLDESYRTGVTADGSVDYFHLNSIGVGPDGHLIVSSRHTSTIYKVHRTSGAVLWRLGGMRSDFTFGDGAAFRVPARRAAARRRHADAVRQRRDRCGRREGRDLLAPAAARGRRAGAHGDAAAGLRPADAAPHDGDGERAGAARRRGVRRLGNGRRLQRVRTGRHRTPRLPARRRLEHLPRVSRAVGGAPGDGAVRRALPR
jgi:hypothetical protein